MSKKTLALTNPPAPGGFYTSPSTPRTRSRKTRRVLANCATLCLFDQEKLSKCALNHPLPTAWHFLRLNQQYGGFLRSRAQRSGVVLISLGVAQAAAEELDAIFFATSPPPWSLGKRPHAARHVSVNTMDCPSTRSFPRWQYRIWWSCALTRREPCRRTVKAPHYPCRSGLATNRSRQGALAGTKTVGNGIIGPPAMAHCGVGHHGHAAALIRDGFVNRSECARG